MLREKGGIGRKREIEQPTGGEETNLYIYKLALIVLLRKRRV